MEKKRRAYERRSSNYELWRYKRDCPKVIDRDAAKLGRATTLMSAERGARPASGGEYVFGARFVLRVEEGREGEKV